MATSRRLTHYDVLDVDPHAPVGDIHAAWRQMATLVHPDAALADSDPDEYADRELMMKTINASWEILGDQDRRAAYDTSIGLDRPRTKLLLALRRALRAAGRPRAAAPIRLHRPSLLSRPPLLAEAQTLGHLAWGTRLGQWGILLVTAGVAQLLSLSIPPDIRGFVILTAIGLMGWALARGGEPTPVIDAMTIARASVLAAERAMVVLALGLAREVMGLMRHETPPAGRH